MYTLYLFNRFSLQPFWEIRHDARLDQKQNNLGHPKSKKNTEPSGLSLNNSASPARGEDEEEEEKKLVDVSENVIIIFLFL